MPISSTQSSLESGIFSALNQQNSATKLTVSTQITNAMASSASAGLISLGSSVQPTVPIGFTATQSSIFSALSLGIAAQPIIIAPIISTGISVLSPIVPPIGFSLLQAQVFAALNKGNSATKQIVARELAAAFITYYKSGGVF